jgi:glycosyltransferase involved in cell wall biosynthesis
LEIKSLKTNGETPNRPWQDLSVSVILPAYNEEYNITKTLDRARQVLRDLEIQYEIIVVNDGSTDKTADFIREMISFDPAIQVVEHSANRGYGAALKSGLRAASKSLIFFTDSDLQFDISELERLLEWINRHPIVIGYREERRDHLLRRVMAWGWGVLIRFLFDLKVRDIDCAFKLFRSEVFKQVSINSIGAFVNSEILIRSQKRGFTIKEIPVAHFPRQLGIPSGAKPKIILRAFRELLKLYRELK